ncbi:MAG: hypothetical protein U0835_25415 [Isosphaeraceae bacterium]
MKPETPDWAQVVEALGAMRQELARLGERVSALESGAKPAAPVLAPTPPPAPALAPAPAPKEAISEELVLVISAAVAAFLGKKAPVRQIRLIGSAAWTQHGRVTIQASHVLHH